MRVLAEGSEEEMVASFLCGELSSERFGAGVREQLAAIDASEELLTQPDLADARANSARARVLAVTRGYGEDRELFEFFPAEVRWTRALLAAGELATVRYIEYSYWTEIPGGTRLSADAARRINAGVEALSVPNERFFTAAGAVSRGARCPPLILAGAQPGDLVCPEGNLRLTGHALAGFPVEVECLVRTAPTLRRWAQQPQQS